MTLSESLKRTVRQRAGDCCEYCKLPSFSGTAPFHVDHVIPRKHGGSDTSDNLCYACYKCNAHKSHDLTGIDPETNTITTLFNPRQHQWDDHFLLHASMVIGGQTAIGRTTARVLRMNDEHRVENRYILFELGDYPCATTSADDEG